MLVICNHN